MRPRGTDRTLVQDTGEAESSLKAQVSSASVHDQLALILADPLFHNRKRLSEFLTYIVEQTLEQHHDTLKERIIGIEVFGRSPDFDTNLESIVRVTATELRKRLARYYENPEHINELRIDVPARSYVATFESPKEHLKTAELPKPEPPVPGPRFKKIYLLLPVAICLLLAVFWATRSLRHQPPAIDRFWAPIVSSGASNKVFISIAQPSGIPPATSPQWTSTNAGSELTLSRFIAQQANFPIADLSAANAMIPFLSHHGKDAAIRLAGSITLSDLHSSPVVLLGSATNEWTVRLGANLRFRFQTGADTNVRWIEDSSNPASRSWSLNVNDPYEKVSNEYVLITRSTSSSTGQWWVGICGLTVLGTIQGQQMVIDPNTMEALAGQLPKDWYRKNLQMVIQISMVNGSLGAYRVVASNTW